MNLRSEKGLSGVDMTTGIIIFMIGSVVIFNMYSALFSLASKLKVNEAAIGYITQICERIDYEKYDNVTESKVNSIIGSLNLPSGLNITLGDKDGNNKIKTYLEEFKDNMGYDLPFPDETPIEKKDLVKRVNLRVHYSIDGQNRDYVIGKIKIREVPIAGSSTPESPESP